MRNFNNEDILLSENATRKLLNMILIPHSNSLEDYGEELRCASFNDTDEGTVFHFPELEIDIHTTEPEMEVSCHYNLVAQMSLRYSTEASSSSRTNTVVCFDNVVKKSSEYSADKKQDHYSCDDYLEELLRIA